MKFWKQAVVATGLGALVGLAVQLLVEKADASPLPAVAATVPGITRSVSEIGLLLALNGSPSFLGCISATTTAKNNADATAFTIAADTKALLIVPSAAAKILPDTDATEDITTTNGVPLAAGQHFYMILTSGQTYLQAITDTSTSSVCVWGLN